MLTRGKIYLESLVQCYRNVVKLCTRTQRPHRAINHKRAGPLIPLIIELNPAKLQLVRRQERKYAPAPIAYIRFETWPFACSPDALVRP
jgi:hypothetical protein